MWIFTTIGFYSVTKAPNTDGRMQIRARDRADLERLLEEWQGEAKIIETPEADYRWRILVTTIEWWRIAELLAESIDYENFKDAAHETQFDKPLMQIWSLMAGHQSGTIRRHLREEWDVHAKDHPKAQGEWDLDDEGLPLF